MKIQSGAQTLKNGLLPLSGRLCLGLLLAYFIRNVPVCAQAAPSSPAFRMNAPARPLRVATRVIAPFVIQQNGRLTGFSIDLWQSISEEMGTPSRFSVQPNVLGLLAAVKSNRADLGISAISITAERNKDFDFSQPMFESGLQIMVRDQASGEGLLPRLVSFFPPALLRLIGAMLVIILLPAHMVWLAERRHPSGTLPKAYLPGILHACWWALATLATQAEEMPKSPWGRLLAVVWMFVGVAFVAYFTATLTASQTVQQLRGSIQDVDDLPGKRVATTTGSTAAQYLRERGAQVEEFPRIEDAYDALASGRADAVVFDSPVLLYYASHEGRGKVRVIGAIFREENYGIVLPLNSPYRKPINHALLRLREKGTYDELYGKWFRSR